MDTTLAMLLVGGLVALCVATVVKWVWFVRLRRRADRDKPMPLNTERARAIRALAAADYAERFAPRRNGHPR